MRQPDRADTVGGQRGEPAEHPREIRARRLRQTIRAHPEILDAPEEGTQRQGLRIVQIAQQHVARQALRGRRHGLPARAAQQPGDVARAGQPALQLGDVKAARGEKGVHLVLRRLHVGLAIGRTFEVAHENLCAVGQAGAVLVDVAVKPGLPFGLQRLGVDEDRGRGADRCHRRYDLVQGIGEKRVMRQAVGEGFDGALERLGPVMQRCQDPGPAGEPLGELLGMVEIGVVSAGRGGRLMQTRDERGLGAFRQQRRLDLQRLGEFQQGLAADLAAVMLDQV